MTRSIATVVTLLGMAMVSCCLFTWTATPVKAAAPTLAQIEVDEETGEVTFGPETELTAEQLAQLEQTAQGVMAVVMVVGLIAFVIQIILLIMNFTAASSIPEEHQQVAPWMVFLFLVPCVNLVMFFIVFPGISRGFQSYFNAQGRTDVGDCGAGLGLGTAICLILLGPVGFVLWIILSLKFNGFKKEIEAGGAAAA